MRCITSTSRVCARSDLSCHDLCRIQYSSVLIGNRRRHRCLLKDTLLKQ